MAWGKNARDDTDYPQPQKLSANGWAKPLNQRSNGLETWDAHHPEDREPVNFTKLEHEMTRDRIAEIKVIVGKLTYGEMIDMAEQLAAAMPDQSGNLEAKAKMKSVLPQTLHAWATSADASPIHQPASVG